MPPRAALPVRPNAGDDELRRCLPGARRCIQVRDDDLPEGAVRIYMGTDPCLLRYLQQP